MKKTFQIGTGTFGTGKPKICAPIVAVGQEDIFRKAEEIACLPVDMAEWRVDFYEDALDKEKVLEVLRGLKERLMKKALLFTFRTIQEGGEQEISKEGYYGLNRTAASSGCVALVDVEAFLDEERSRGEIRCIQKAGCKVLASNHDFDRTPSVQEMVRRLGRMEALGADAAKLAVMPASKRDVLALLEATVQADEELGIPVTTMSMGRLGVVSRICGSLTGSAMTFASAGEASAPGQLPAVQMAELLELL